MLVAVGCELFVAQTGDCTAEGVATEYGVRSTGFRSRYSLGFTVWYGRLQGTKETTSKLQVAF